MNQINILVSFMQRKDISLHLNQYFVQVNKKKLHKASYILLQFKKLLFFIMTPEAERFNGWAAMLGFVAAVGAYVTTGQIIPGWF